MATIAGGLSGAGDAGVTAASQFLNLGYTGSDNAERGMPVTTEESATATQML